MVSASGTEGGGRQGKPHLRTCVGCGSVAERSTLARIVRSPQGAVFCDGGQKAAGRGAYVCSPECLQMAVRRKKLDRALRTTLASDQIATIAASVEALGLDARK